MTERNYYHLIKDGFADTQLRQFATDCRKIKQAWFDFAKTYGSDNLYAADDLSAIKLPKDKVPEGWKNPKGIPSGYYRPMNVKACKEARKEWDALKRLPGGFDLCNRLKVGSVMGESNRKTYGFGVSFPSFEEIGEEIILSLAEGSKIPADTVEPAMKMSEYWALKEAQETS